MTAVACPQPTVQGAPGRRPRRASRVLVAALTALLVGATVAAARWLADAPGRAAIGPGVVTVTIDIEHSRYSLARLAVQRGTLVRFVVVNGDPIHHELIVGPPDVHRAHAEGTELAHPPVPGEVSVGPNGTGTTFLRFDEPGPVRFACHLPGHVAYGMQGVIEVIG